MASILIFFTIILLFILLFGAILYIISHYFFTKWAESKVKQSTAKLWLWRLTMVVVIFFVLFVLFSNRNLVIAIALSNFFFIIALLIFFIAMIEMVVIDLLLPDIIPIWKRILIECVIFMSLVLVTLIVFKVYAPFFTSQVI